MTARMCHTVPMRVSGARIALVALVGALLGWAPAVATAAPTPTPNPSNGATNAKKGTTVCVISDRNALEISGIALSNGTLYAVNDQTSSDARRKVFKFNPSTCALVGTPIGYPARPLDPEDIAADAQGNLWIADIGDNNSQRPTVALWKLAGDKITGPYRLSYPDGKKYDAEAMVMSADGLPIIITKLPEPFVFVPSGPLVDNSTNGVPLKQAGKVTLPKTNTENPFSAPGRLTVTSAAVSPDRSKVVLRTYADAFEWAVPDGDIVKAITTGKPKITPLPQEPWGEAITYSPDGKFLTLSDVEQFENTTKQKPELLSYTPNAEDPNPPTPAAAVQPPPTSDKAWWSELISSTTRLYMVIGSVGVFGLLLVLLGILGIRRARKRRQRDEEADERHDGYQQDGYYDQGYGYQDPAYGYPDQHPGGNPGSNVYGPPQPQGNVYGSSQGGGNVYGSPQQYGYPDQPYYGPEQPQYGQQPGYGYPDQGGGYPPNQGGGYPPNQGYPDQGYEPPPYR